MPAVISGELRARQFSAPRGHRTHPMSTKVRGALFNSLGDLDGLTVLDAFAGSGALGFEAISNGAIRVLFIDNDKEAQKTILANIDSLGVQSKAKLTKANCSSWSDRNPDELFDIVLLDPPYDQVKDGQLYRLAEHTKPGGIVVLSLPPTSDFMLSTNHYSLLTTKSYGDATLSFYRKSDQSFKIS